MESEVNAIMMTIHILLYYIIIPLGIIYGLWRIWGVSTEQKMINEEWPSKYERDISSAKKSKISRTGAIFVVFIIITFSLWGFSASSIAGNSIHREIRGGGMFSPVIRDPVVNTLGPSYNTDEIINEMEENSDIWMYDVLDEVIDFNSLTKIPGRLAIYQLNRGRYAVTYTYLSPIPMMRAYGFQFLLYEGGQRILAGSREETYIFPMYPDITGIANL